MKSFFYIIPALLLCLVSCEKELDFQYHDIEPQFVVEGNLTREGGKVLLTTTTPMNEKIEENYLGDAEVFIKDLSTNEEFKLECNDKNIYQTSCHPVVGNEYMLTVRREGKEYSASCLMRPATKIIGLLFQWIKMPYDHVAVLQISFKDLPTDNDCYWIKIYRNDLPYKWIISDDRSAVNGVINEVVMTTRQDLDEEDEKDILRDGDVVKVVINTISREMYDYLIAIQSDSNGPTMFEGDFCLGYFLASEEASDFIIFRPDELTQYE